MAQKDVHAYGTLAIAKAAGYSDDDAVLLAWSNIETDYSLQVKPWNCLWSNLGLYFHFWPSDKKDLICQVDSDLSKRIIGDEAILSLPSAPLGLIALGIALHGFQDTYFHSTWVGKFSRHNVLPAWSHDKFTPSLPFPYGHSPKPEADIANATWYDPRSNEVIVNNDRVTEALNASARVLGLEYCPSDILAKMYYESYEVRKQKLRDLAGMPNLKFTEIRKEMLNKYRNPFFDAAKAQAEIVRSYLNRNVK